MLFARRVGVTKIVSEPYVLVTVLFVLYATALSNSTPKPELTVLNSAAPSVIVLPLVEATVVFDAKKPGIPLPA